MKKMKKIKPWKELPDGMERDWVAGYICPDCKQEVDIPGAFQFVFCPLCGKRRMEVNEK